jgi:hypothetical protein
MWLAASGRINRACEMAQCRSQEGDIITQSSQADMMANFVRTQCYISIVITRLHLPLNVHGTGSNTLQINRVDINRANKLREKSYCADKLRR